jgi:NitT/TauT family transport system ATP-binding protein
VSAAAQRPAVARDRELAPGSLILERVSMRFGERPVVANCSFVLEPGTVTAMIGPSGCGKSTIGFLVAGYERPTEGEIRLGGKPVRGPSHERFLVFQETSLMPWMTTLENVTFGPLARGVRKREARAAATAVLERVGLADFHDNYPSQLSGGMQRRAEFARALSCSCCGSAPGSVRRARARTTTYRSGIRRPLTISLLGDLTIPAGL